LTPGILPYGDHSLAAKPFRLDSIIWARGSDIISQICVDFR